MRLGKHQKYALNLAMKYPGWHSYDNHCSATKRVINSLKDKGLIEVSGCQFRYIHDDIRIKNIDDNINTTDSHEDNDFVI